MSLRSWRSARRRMILRIAYLRLVARMGRFQATGLTKALASLSGLMAHRAQHQACALLIGEPEEFCCGSFGCLLIGRLDNPENLPALADEHCLPPT